MTVSVGEGGYGGTCGGDDGRAPVLRLSLCACWCGSGCAKKRGWQGCKMGELVDRVPAFYCSEKQVMGGTDGGLAEGVADVACGGAVVCPSSLQGVHAFIYLESPTPQTSIEAGPRYCSNSHRLFRRKEEKHIRPCQATSDKRMIVEMLMVDDQKRNQMKWAFQLRGECSTGRRSILFETWNSLVPERTDRSSNADKHDTCPSICVALGRHRLRGD